MKRFPQPDSSPLASGRRTFLKTAALAVAAPTIVPATVFGQIEETAVPDGPYTAEWASLQKHEPAPEWFKDAKFGIWCHWGVCSVPAFDDWYGRNMYIKGSPVYRHHVETYGDPSVFGYHDFVPMFKAEKFNAEQWAQLFQEAGAKFAGPVAEHHDGFSMWASDLTPWNSSDKGPKRDILGEIATAVRARGMKLCASFHHARNNQHLVFGINGYYDGVPHHYLEWTGHFPRVAGWPTVSEDPELRMLYGNIPRDQFLKLWLGKLEEVIDHYQPDIILFDTWLDEIPEKQRQEFSAYYLNSAAQWGRDVVITRKQEDLPLDYTVEDVEKGRMKDVTQEVWLSSDTISNDGSWFYTKNLTIKSSATVLHSLIDIVSKNGVLLLNVSPMADGAIPDNQQKVLKDIGGWLKVNGEAIYATRPWTVFGEGPTDKTLPKANYGVGVTDPKGGYTVRDIRFTRSKDGSILYAIVLGQPVAGSTLEIKSITGTPAIKSITMLGSEEKIDWKWNGSTLSITAPRTVTDNIAITFKINLG